MSVILALKDSDSVVLATDSRVMNHDFSAPFTDAEQKVHEIAPGQCIATAGWVVPCHFQAAKARELANELNTTDIRAICASLEWESITYLQDFLVPLTASNLPEIDGALSGQKILHVSVLVGRNATGELGYLVSTYWVRDGQVTVQRQEYFGSERQIFLSAGDLAGSLPHDHTVWTDTPVRVVRRFLATLKQASQRIGGPDQIVELDRHGGAHWASPPPAPSLSSAGLTNRVQTALFTGTATFAHSNGGAVQVGAGGMTLVDDYNSPNFTIAVTPSGLSIERLGGNSLLITATGVGIYGPSGSLTATSAGIVISNGSSSVTVGASAVTVVNGVITSPTINGGSLIGTTLSITNGTRTLNVDSANWFRAYDGATSSYSTMSAYQTTTPVLNCGQIMAGSMPTSNPGVGSGQLWCDPNDGNRVKKA